MKKKIILSNGYRNFHLYNTANELKKRKYLSFFICGLYPTTLQKKILNLFNLKSYGKIIKYFQRDVGLDDNIILQNKIGELCNLIGEKFKNYVYLKKLSKSLIKYAIKLYVNNAIKLLSKLPKNNYIYHFRSGYGGKSIDFAKKKGYLTICDHSIVNPTVLESLIKNKKTISIKNKIPNDLIMQKAMVDLKKSDIILVNSDFVKKTFYNTEIYNKIKVVYLGIENSFIKRIKSIKKKKSKNLKILFAGSIDKRKGIDDMNLVFDKIKNLNVEIKLAGPLDQFIKKKYKKFFSNHKVSYLGVLNKKNLAKEMLQTNVFLFLSKAEGSARVIFEAMASGCTIITTINSGSIVQNKINGFIVKPNETEKVARLISRLIKYPKMLVLFSNNNLRLIKKKYLQKNYGENLEKIYNFNN